MGDGDAGTLGHGPGVSRGRVGTDRGTGQGGFLDAQSVNSTPRLQDSNRFACLPIEEVEEPSTPLTHESTTTNPDVQNSEKTPPPINTESTTESVTDSARPTPIHRIRLSSWEKRLPRQYVVAASPSALSLELPVEVETTDTQEVKSVTALVDSGATGLFIHPDFVKRHRLTTRPLARPIPEPAAVLRGLTC